MRTGTIVWIILNEEKKTRGRAISLKFRKLVLPDLVVVVVVVSLSCTNTLRDATSAKSRTNAEKNVGSN